MHRQSLGSPALKLHSHGVLFAGDGVIKDDMDNNFISDDLRKNKLASSSVSDEERKSQKLPYQQKHVLVHLIPLLTFLCFLILYLSSHDPSRKDLAQFNGFATFPSKKNVIADSIEFEDNAGGGLGFLEIKNNEALGIRSMRNLQQQQQPHNYRLHRKFGQ